jgi:putative transposase
VSRYLLYPTPAQETVLLEHCAHARFVWNLAVEQRLWWRPGGPPAPGFAEQGRQLTEARAAFPWLAKGSVIVQQQALRDFHAVWANWYAVLAHWRSRTAKLPPEQRPSPPSPPSWRKRDVNEGFRIVATGPQDARRLNRRRGEVLVPKLGWVSFRWSRPVPDARSYRVTRDRAGRWHVAFAAIPPAIPGPGRDEVVGVDRGVAVSAALSTGELLSVPGLRPAEQRRLKRLERRKARQRKGSTRRARTRLAIARLRGRETARRHDWTEKVSTDLARRFDLIRVEDLDVRAMTRSAKGTLDQPGRNVRQKAGLNRGILANGWGALLHRLEDKAPGRVEKIHPAYTSQRCSVCGHVAPGNRENQGFRCVACGHQAHADVNAACNIAAGHAVTAWGGEPLGTPTNREPTALGPLASSVGIPVLPGQGGCQSTTRMRRQFSQRLTSSGDCLRTAASSTGEIDTRQPWQVFPTSAAAPTPPCLARIWS